MVKSRMNGCGDWWLAASQAATRSAKARPGRTTPTQTASTRWPSTARLRRVRTFSCAMMAAVSVAALPMYDWPEIAPATDRLWAALQDVSGAFTHQTPHALDGVVEGVQTISQSNR